MDTIVVSKNKIRLNKIKTFFQKPQNTILVVFAVFLSIATFVPILILLFDTIKVHPGSIDSVLTGKTSGVTLFNWKTLFTDDLAKQNFWIPLANSLILSVFSCAGAILFGGTVAYLVTRTNLKFKRFISTVFIFPYIMPQWTLAVIWQNLFKVMLLHALAMAYSRIYLGLICRFGGRKDYSRQSLYYQFTTLLSRIY